MLFSKSLVIGQSAVGQYGRLS